MQVLEYHSALPMKEKGHSLGVHPDSHLLLDPWVAAVTRRAFTQLLLVHQLWPSLDCEDLAMVTYATVTSRLDFCNVLYVRVPSKMVWKLQLVQNVAARMIAGWMQFVGPLL